jgi:beta-N-acetylhexosaminidase
MIPDSLSKLAGQALVCGFEGDDPPPSLLAAAQRGELGGFILFRRNLGDPAQVAELTRRLIASCTAAAVPPWIAVDQEGGRVQRLRAPVMQLPPMRALGQIDDPALTERAAALLGRQLAALGFNIDFAPVLDVDSNPASPVIGDRSFGAEPERVVRHGAAFARGLRTAGVASCGKHFPGHGDAALDSHHALPRVEHDRERLERVELAPFRAVAPELDAIMTAHIVFQAIDAERAATLSSAVLEGELRTRIGFEGVVFSDDLEMKAVSEQLGAAEAACAAIAAGCDALLVCSRPDLCLEAHAALVQRAEREPAFAARLRRAAERNLTARSRYPRTPAPAAQVADLLHALADRSLEERLAQGRA